MLQLPTEGSHPSSMDQRYEVLVGHARLQVIGSSPTEAIDQARKALCQELPRLWDRIQRLNPEVFQVRPL